MSRPYRRTAQHYTRGRPPYSRDLRGALGRELGLDGTGRLLDVGCGPGVVAIELAPLFEEAVGLDPEPDMLAEARRRAPEITWVHGRAEDLPELGLGSFRVVTFGQSFHWTDRIPVADAVYDLLLPGGAIVLLAPDAPGRPVPQGPGHPPIPHDEIRAVVERYIGNRRREPGERYADSLARSRFGRPRVIHAPGRADLVQDAELVISNVLSMSWAAPHLFGDRLHEFEDDVRDLLAERSPSGLFWDWPGDTAMVIGRKPS
jgi:SAM-dependent methyltransferase